MRPRILPSGRAQHTCRPASPKGNSSLAAPDGHSSKSSPYKCRRRLFTSRQNWDVCSGKRQCQSALCLSGGTPVEFTATLESALNLESQGSADAIECAALDVLK